MNAQRLRLFVALSVSVLLIAAASPALGLANRVFVSARSGNNANACDNINTPCQTFAGAVVQLNSGGEAIVLDSGGYGPVTITQSLTIEAPPGVLAFIHPPSGVAITVNAGASGVVVLRGLTIDGAGVTSNGINVTAVSVLHVENCVITGFAGSLSNGSGISFKSAGQLFVKDTISRGNSVAGIVVIPSVGAATASVDHCRLEQNTWGLICNSNAKVTIRDSVASGNVTSGLQAEGGGELNADGCLVANNFFGLVSSGAGTIVRASNCTVTDNGTGLSSFTSSLLSRSNNTVEGNTINGTFTGPYSAQ